MHAHSCLRRHSIPHHQWCIQDFSEGGASDQTIDIYSNIYDQTQYGKVGGGGGALTPKIFALQISEVVIINCKALAIQ